MANEKSIFEKLNGINVNDHTEDKKGLTYLSWAWAWAEVKKAYPDASYEIERFDNNLPYVYDDKTGYMVFTKVTIGGLTHEMWLPVMDSNNKAMKSEKYTYDTSNRKGIVVEAATMFDVNKTIMRCLTKNLAMFGLGLYIYAGEDLPEDSDDGETKNAKELNKDLLGKCEKMKIDLDKLAVYLKKNRDSLTDEDLANAIESKEKYLASRSKALEAKKND